MKTDKRLLRKVYCPTLIALSGSKNHWRAQPFTGFSAPTAPKSKCPSQGGVHRVGKGTWLPGQLAQSHNEQVPLWHSALQPCVEGKHSHLTCNRTRILYKGDIIPRWVKIGSWEKEKKTLDIMIVCGLSSGHTTQTDILYIHSLKMSQGKGSFRKR